MKKATHDVVSKKFLERRVHAALVNGWPKQRWIVFCEKMLERGYNVMLYEARSTFSKYITVRHKGRSFKVRFSNHKPNRKKEVARDCDFFVGVGHTATSNTADAIRATIEFLESQTGELNAEAHILPGTGEEAALSPSGGVVSQAE